MEPYTIEKSFTINGGGMLRRVVIPAKDLKEQDGMTFMHVSSVSTYMLALCCAGSQQVRRPLSKTNIIEQLIELRNVHATAPPVPERLNSFAPKATPRPCRANVIVDEIAGVGTIVSPTIGDVQGIEMKILGFNPGRGFNAKCAPLYVELDPENIAYLRNACQWQIDHENIKRRKTEKKVVESVDVETDPDGVNADVDVNAEVGESVDVEADVEEVGSTQQTESPPQQEDRERQCDPGLQTPVKATEKSKITSFFRKKVT